MMGTQNRGFASMDRTKQRLIAKMGGQTAHQRGTAHQWTKETAKTAGRKGGLASAASKKAKREAQVAVPPAREASVEEPLQE